MKRTAINAHIEASKKYNPLILKDFLIKLEDGSVVVDRAKLVTNKDEERLFYVILNKDYGWDYQNPRTATIFFEAVDNIVLGGIYDAEVGRRFKRVVAEKKGCQSKGVCNTYLYDDDALSSILSSIRNSR